MVTPLLKSAITASTAASSQTFWATSVPCLGSPPSSSRWNVSFCPPMPPAALACRIASSMPFIQVVPNSASELVSGPALPMTMSARAAPDVAATSAAIAVKVEKRMLTIPFALWLLGIRPARLGVRRCS